MMFQSPSRTWYSDAPAIPLPPVMKTRNIQASRRTFDIFYLAGRFFLRPNIQPKKLEEDLVRAIRGSSSDQSVGESSTAVRWRARSFTVGFPAGQVNAYMEAN